jgi:hypothetical protein
LGAERWLRRGYEGIGKKLLEGLELTYARIKTDREAESARRETERLSRIKDKRQYQEALQDSIRRERASKKGYTQPMEATWREFLQKRDWTPNDVQELPEDYVYSEFCRYILQIKYGVLN